MSRGGRCSGAGRWCCSAAPSTPLLRGELAPTTAALAALALLVVLGASRLPQAQRTGPVVGALLVGGSAVVDLAAPVQAVLLPLSWPGALWTLADGSSLRAALAPSQVWTGPAVTPLVVLAAAATVLLAGRALDRSRLALLPAAALVLAGVVLVPLALDLPYAAGLALLLVVAGAAAAGGAALLGRSEAVPLAGAGVVLALHACAWATASQTATLVVLPLVALGCAALAVPRSPRPAVPVLLAGLLATAHVAALGVASDLADDRIGGLLLVVVAGALLAAALLDDERARRRRGGRGRRRLLRPRRSRRPTSAGCRGCSPASGCSSSRPRCAPTAAGPPRSAGCCCRRRRGCASPTPG